MRHPHYDPRSQRQPQVVPLHVAERLQLERDALVKQLQRARQDQQEMRRHSNELLHQRTAAAAAEAESAAANARVESVRAELDAALAEIRGLQAQLSSAKAGQPDGAKLQRLAADLANARRRKDLDVTQARKQEQGAWIRRLAEVRDSIQRALDANPDHASVWYQGNLGILSQIDHALRDAGVELIGEVGQRFDPHLHEALANAPGTAHASGTIVTVERPGLRLADTLVRPARVVVAA